MPLSGDAASVEVEKGESLNTLLQTMGGTDRLLRTPVLMWALLHCLVCDAQQCHRFRRQIVKILGRATPLLENALNYRLGQSV